MVGVAARRDRPRRRRGGRPGRHRPPAAADAGPALGRPAAARRAGARDRAPAAAVPARRAAVQPRRQAAPRDARSSCSKLQRALGVTTVYVTHDQEEAMTLADRIAVFMDGRIVQVGTPREIFAPAAVGRRRRLHRHAADEPAAGDVGGARRQRRRHRRCRSRSSRRSRATSSLGVRPGDLRIADGGLAARVERVEDLGDSAIVNLKVGAQPLKLKTDRLPDVREGDDAFVDFAPDARPPVRRRRRRAPRLITAPRTSHDHERQDPTERRPDPQRRHGLLRPRLLRRRDRDAEPRSPRRQRPALHAVLQHRALQPDRAPRC